MNGSFAPMVLANEAAHRQLIAEAANAALRGESHNTGRFTAPAGAAFVLEHPRIGVGKEIVLTARNAAAATVGWYLSDEGTGKVTINFIPPLAEPGVFGFAVIGVGNTKTQEVLP